MRPVTKYFLFLTILATTISGCDTEKIIDENFKEKSLVILAPDFIKNRVTVVVKDEDTGLPTDREFEVKIYSNKKIIDLSGNYRNTFKINNGILNFALDPNETVSEASPLELSLYGQDKTRMFIPFYNSKKISREGDDIILSYTSEVNLTSISGKGARLLNKSEIVFLKDIFLKVNNSKVVGIGLYESNTMFRGLKINSIDSGDITEFDSINEEYTIGGKMVIEINEDEGPIKEDFVFKGGINPERTDLFGNFLRTAIDVTYEYEGSLFSTGYPKSRPSATVPKGAFIKKIVFEAIYANDYYLTNCEEGFNFKFSGLSGDQEISLEYGVTVNRIGESSRKPYIFGIESLSVNNDSFNTGINNYYSLNSNRVVFLEDPQYIIEPQEMDLGGEEACGKTYNFKVYPRDGNNRYQLNLQFQCAGEDFSTAPSVVAFLKEESSPIKASLIQFSNGSTNLALNPNTKYLVQGDFNGSEFGFTFTANEDNVEAAIASTIANNDNILDIEYTISKINNVESVINAKIIFKEGACPE